MINNAQFRIIGRIGKVTKLDKVTHISVASDRQVKDADGNWNTETNWNTVTTFSEQMRKRQSRQTRQPDHRRRFDPVELIRERWRQGLQDQPHHPGPRCPLLRQRQRVTEHRAASKPPTSLISLKLTKEHDMTFEQTLELTEIEADMAFERYLEAFNADEHPEMLDQLTTEAQSAQERYDEMINLVPAH